MKRKLTVAAIVPAYNEEKNIHQTLLLLTKSGLFDQVICINDGSTDNTKTEAKRVGGVILIDLKKNHGKGYAIVHGIKKAQTDTLIFIDADLIGLTPKHIQNLITPLSAGVYRAVVGYPAGGVDDFLKPITGERAYWKEDLVPHLDNMAKKGYGLELYLNYLFHDKKVLPLPLKGVKNTLKHNKQNYDIALRLVVVELFDMFVEIVKQPNPSKYLLRSYLYPFYMGRHTKKSEKQIVTRIMKHIKNQLMSYFQQEKS
jgi:polyisoprenyl-phosphate glycosyltransferase